MTTIVVQVFFERDLELPDGKRAPFSLVEIENSDFETFVSNVDMDRLISGNLLRTSWSETLRNVRVVRDRRPFIFRGCAVMRASLSTQALLDGDEGAGT